MKFTHESVINAPVDAIDLEEWLFNLSDSDYQAASCGHRAAGTFTENGVRGMVNVEAVGGALMVQHYHEVNASPARVEMWSERTQAWLYHVIPTHFGVRWTMTATARTSDTTTFACTVELELPAWLRAASALIGTRYFLRKHVQEEAPNFAADISRKLTAARV